MQDGTLNSLKITVMGCSTGAEAYSIASVLRERHPDLSFTVYAYDIDSECIDKAKSARYTSEEVFKTDRSGKSTITTSFIHATFHVEDDSYVIKNDVRKRVQFDWADALDPNLKRHVGASDIVYAQHVLIHLDSRKAKKAFKNICSLLNPRAALFIAGMDLHILEEQTRKHGLIPSDYHTEEIYREMEAYGGGWPWNYDALEPFMTVQREWQRRYSTIFLKH